MSEQKEADSLRVAFMHLSEDKLLAVRGSVPYKVRLVQMLYFMEGAAFYGFSESLRVFVSV